jgi:hypothetical protein
MTKRIFIVLTLTLIFTACGSSQRNCDAYGSLTITE